MIQPVTFSIDPTVEEQDILDRARRDGRYLPATALRAMQLSDDPNCDIGDLADLVGQDPLLAIDIFRVANSAQFSGDNPTKCLRAAVTRIGLRTSRQIVAGAALSRFTKAIPSNMAERANAVRLNSLNAGLLCQYINSTWDLRFEGEEYAAALLYDVGELLFICSGSRDSRNFEAYESSLHLKNVDLARLGAAYAMENSIDERIVNIIWPRCKSDGPEEVDRLAALVTIGYQLASYTDELDSCQFSENRELQLATERLHPSLFTDINCTYRETVIEAIREASVLASEY